MGCTGSSSPMAGPFSDDITYTRPGFHQQYHLRAKLGRGAFAQVHLALKLEGLGAGEEVAVKISDLRSRMDLKLPTPERLPQDDKKARAAEMEANILRKVDAHPNIVRIFEDYQEDSFSYIVMERCDRTLLQMLERLPDIKEHALLPILAEMLVGLVHVHGLSVVHRDIKPDNFLCCGAQNQVKLCDFGLAAVSRGSCDLRGVYGTAPFMSPEMLGTGGYGAATDIWSFGVIVYVLLLGRFPYQPIESNTKAMKAAILAGQPAPTFKLKPGLDASGKAKISNSATMFLKALLCRDPAARPVGREALQHSWMHSQAEPDEPPLRPMLHSAKRSGAFDTRKLPENSDTDKNSMDAMLAVLQGRHGKADSPGVVRLPATATARRTDRTTFDSADAESVLGKAARTDSTTEQTTNSSNFTSSSRSNLSAAA
mmetsp:Transcript_37515/g.84622  ORF Transcript_37515/g.84622 Transcript_37515/m.84622 type:complete len:427 (-) Transcript_37515:60-1340(-)